jgi:flagellar biosynthesis protein FlhG
VVQGHCTIDEVLIDVAENLQVCPAARAFGMLDGLAPSEEADLLAALASLRNAPDVILIDAAHDHPLGISPVGLAASETVVVLSGNSHAITGSYALIKRVAENCGRRHFRVLINKVRQASEAGQIFTNLSRVATQRAVASIGLAGLLPFDDAVSHAAWLQQPLLRAFPDSVSAEAFRCMAMELMQWEIGQAPEGVEHFMQHLVSLNQQLRPAAGRPIYQGANLAR